MKNVLKLFEHDLKTPRLELRLIKPTKETAKDFWDIIKKENPDDYKYIGFAPGYMEKPLPTSEQETLETLLKECNMENSVNYAVYNNNKLIGFAKIIYWEKGNVLEMAELWFIKSARGKGFAKEINDTIEKIARSEPNIHCMGWQCFEPNTSSKKAALRNGYELLGFKPDSIKTDLTRMVFIKPFHIR